MDPLVASFQQHIGLRGVHVYSDEGCRFLPWKEILAFVNRLPQHPGPKDPEFSEKLIDSLANYDPNKQFLAIHQDKDKVSIELYARQV